MPNPAHTHEVKCIIFSHSSSYFTTRVLEHLRFRFPLPVSFAIIFSGAGSKLGLVWQVFPAPPFPPLPSSTFLPFPSIVLLALPFHPLPPFISPLFTLPLSLPLPCTPPLLLEVGPFIPVRRS